MPIAFPSSPTQGQTTVTGGRTWTWDGVSWAAASTVDLIAVSSNVTPVSTLAYDLGSSTLRWRDLYMSGNTIDLGGTAIKSSANGVSFTSAANAAAAVPLTVSSLQIASATGNVVTLQATATGLQTVATSGNVVATTPGGSSGHVQYNLAGAFAGSANLTFDGTALTMAANPVLSAGTANGVLYLNGSKAATTGSALTFDGTSLQLGTGGTTPAVKYGNGYQTLTGASDSNDFTYRTYANHIWKNITSAGSITDGTELMRLNGTGLGIGTSSPGAKLHVTSNVAVSYSAIIYNTSATGQGLTVRAGSTSSQDAFNVQTYDGNTSLFAVQGGGNVGIGTSSPGYKLDVNGTVNLPLGTWITGAGTKLVRSTFFGYSSGYKVVQVGVTDSTSTGVALGVDVSTNPSGGFSGYEIVIPNNRAIIAPNAANNGFVGVLKIGTDNNLYIGGNYSVPGNIFVNTTTGNTGIGTTTPGTKLHVTGSNGFFAQFLNSTDGTGAGVAFGSSTNLGRISSNGASTALSLEINGTERIRMTSGGDFGIGTNNPNSKLHVNGKITQSSYALDQLNGGTQFVEIRGGSRNGSGIYSLFTRGNSNAQSSGKVYVQAIYGTPATSGYWEYIISGNLNIALIASNISIYSGSVPSIYWDVNTLKVNNTNSNVYYSIIVELHNIGIGWGATWGDFPGFVS